jgi:predicted nucleic acid-binding protein
VNTIEAANVNVHALLVKLASGQLPFPGSEDMQHRQAIDGTLKIINPFLPASTDPG